jgi:hypothetical protein
MTRLSREWEGHEWNSCPSRLFFLQEFSFREGICDFTL